MFDSCITTPLGVYKHRLTIPKLVWLCCLNSELFFSTTAVFKALKSKPVMQKKIYLIDFQPKFVFFCTGFRMFLQDKNVFQKLKRCRTIQALYYCLDVVSFHWQMPGCWGDNVSLVRAESSFSSGESYSALSMFHQKQKKAADLLDCKAQLKKVILWTESFSILTGN